jgi:hypothetical protein
MAKKSSKDKEPQNGGAEVAVASSNLPVASMDMRGDARQGLENIGQEDLAIPFLKILEKLSPEVDKNKADKYIDGAEPGDVWDSVNEKLYKQEEGFFVVPLSYKKEDIEWRLRSAGGGLVKVWPQSENIMSKTKKSADGKHDMLGPDTEVLSTAQHLVIVVDKQGGAYPAIIAMTKARLKASRKWNSKMTALKFEDAQGSYTPPSYGTVWRVNTTPESNDQGSWYNWSFNFEQAVENADLYESAKSTRQAGLEGAMQAKYEDLQDTPTSSPGSADNDKPIEGGTAF